MKILAKILLMTMSLSVLASCDDDKNFTFPSEESAKEFTEMTNIFGFYGQKRYAYCPSLVRLDDGTVHMYFCGNPNETEVIDNVYHVKINPDGTQTEAKAVLIPTPGTWDNLHICDPSVVAGKFTMGGVTYKYAMFYLGIRGDRSYNEIGVAFSNDLEADSWVKYPTQFVTKPWEGDDDQVLPNGKFSWGVGQPTCYSIDYAGKVMLMYTCGDIISTRQMIVEVDMSDMDNFTPVVGKTLNSKGLRENNGLGQDYMASIDVAIDRANNVLIMARPVNSIVSPVNTYPEMLNYSFEVNYMPLYNFENNAGVWQRLIRVTPEMTGYPRNHNVGIERNMYGEVSDWKEPTVFYTVSLAYPEVSLSNMPFDAEWSYTIWRGKVKEVK